MTESAPRYTFLSRRFTFLILGAFAVAAALAGFFIIEPIERGLFVRAVRDATGIELSADSVERAGDGYAIGGLHASTSGGGVVVDAPRGYVVLNGHRLSVSLDRPVIVLDADRHAGVRRALGDATLDVHLKGGRLTIVTGDVPEPKVAFDGLDGALHVDASSTRYDLRLALVDDGRRYPILARPGVAADGSPTQTWSAPFLPLAPFADMLPSSGDAHLSGGTLTNLDVDDGPALKATARLEDGSIDLGAHTLRGLHGALILDNGGLGTRALAGTLDGVPIDGAGEVHDLRGRYAWLRDGSEDLTDLANLVATIGGEPQLRSVRVESTAPGLAYAQYRITGDHGPLAISVLAIDPAEPTLHFGAALAEDHVISGGERTSAMGVRTGAVGGVNGDYFDIGRTYQPQGMLMLSGAIVRGPTDRAALAIDSSNHITFAEFSLNGSVLVNGRRFAVTQVNNWPAGGAGVTVITPGYGKTLAPAPGVIFAPLDPVGGARYRVRDVEPADAPIPVEFGLGFGPSANVSLHAGQIVRMTYALAPSVPRAVTGIGGGPILVKDGQWYDDPHAPAPDERDYRWPVVALARKADGHALMVAVDGRHPERSVGMTRPEFGDLLVRLGAVDAMALDSGGSVTLVSRAPGDAHVSVRNVPSDNSAERWVSDALFLYSSAPAPSIVPPVGTATPEPEARPSP